MTDFDPELYLRLLGEQELASGVDPEHARINGQARVFPAAAALAVAGVIDPDQGETIAADYALAAGLRQGQLGMQLHRRLARARVSAEAASAPLSPRRAFVLDTHVPITDGDLLLHVLTLGEERTSELTCQINWTASRTPGPGNGPAGITLTTPAGQSVSGNFSGGHSDRQANGRFHFDAVIDPESPWIEVAGTRIDLPAPAPPPAVEIENTPPERISVSYLWQLLADFRDRHGSGSAVISAASDALVAAGLLDPDDPELAAIRWTAEEFHGNHHHFWRHQPGPMPAPSTMPEALPDQWRALLSSRRSAPGPQGSLAVGATTPVFAGVAVAVNALQSDAGSFTLLAETSGVDTGSAARFGAPVDPLAWWAGDDRGNAYLGSSGSWSSSGTHGRGEIHFARLDPGARELTVAVTTLSARALIRIPLLWRSPG